MRSSGRFERSDDNFRRTGLKRVRSLVRGTGSAILRILDRCGLPKNCAPSPAKQQNIDITYTVISLKLLYITSIAYRIQIGTRIATSLPIGNLPRSIGDDPVKRLLLGALIA